LIFYIHLNPVKHRIDLDFENYPYSSYGIIVGNENTYVKREDVLKWFGGRKEFITFHHSGIPEDI
jgi:hypothetical protein